MTPVFVREVAWPCATRMARAVLIGSAVSAAVGLVVGPRVTGTFGESRADIARMTVKKYAFEAFPTWEAAHPDRACPSAIAELDRYMSQRDRIDPWGKRYYFACGPHAIPRDAHDIWVVSAGEDQVFGTADDIRSDE